MRGENMQTLTVAQSENNRFSHPGNVCARRLRAFMRMYAKIQAMNMCTIVILTDQPTGRHSEPLTIASKHTSELGGRLFREALESQLEPVQLRVNAHVRSCSTCYSVYV